MALALGWINLFNDSTQNKTNEYQNEAIHHINQTLENK